MYFMGEEISFENKLERIKLTKNTKGFNWELAINGSGENGKLLKEDLERLEGLNNICSEKWGKDE